MDDHNRNFILAIVLSMAVLFSWQYFFLPQPPPEAQKQPQEQQAEPGRPPQPQPDGVAPGTAGAPQVPAAGTAALTREAALAASPRVEIETPSLKGSIALKGARIDDLILKDYRVTVEPNSPNVVLLSPAGGPQAYYAEHGFVAGTASNDLVLPAGDTLWRAETSGPLTEDSPITLAYDNGKGLAFTRTIAVDDKYMFTVTDKVANTGSEPVTLYPFALVSRHELPPLEGFFILHEGLIGVLSEQGLEEISYSSAVDNPPSVFKSDSGWLGITDKYWATVVIPEQGKTFDAKFYGSKTNGRERFQTDYLLGALTVPAGGTAEVKGNVFAGAKEVNVVDGYAEKYSIPKFDLLIDWGWFYFLTKPLFFVLDYFYKLVGNFGVAILIVTVLIKIVFFPLANKSYVAMSKMKKLAPEMQRLKERYGDDRVRQQQAMMEMYKKEKVNPASGCLPILIQIPIFFALYKVLFVTIEMRHAPFFGWIKDLSAPDPTSIFNLFGLIPWEPPLFLMIGIWPIIMGITMWVQMKLNPAPPDPIQAKIFTWMPVFFTFLLASFPAGLVIYWAWNNFLSVIQQATIMARQGVDIPLLENLGFKANKKSAKAETEEAAKEGESAPKRSKRQDRAAKKSGTATAKEPSPEAPQAEPGE
ncbi:MAG: membrane protein insertase YidC [Methyloceanibacter sp.]